MRYNKLMISRRGNDAHLDVLYEVAFDDTKAQILAEARRKELEQERDIRDERDVFYAKQFDEQVLLSMMGMEEMFIYEDYESHSRKSK